MDNKKRMLLQRHQQEILSDLDALYIVDELLSNGGLTFDEYNLIITMTERQQRTRYILDGLIQNGNNTKYQVFVDSLAKDYDWLWKKFDVPNDVEMIEDSFEDSLSRGDVPRLPHHFVTRKSVEYEVKEKLKSLGRHKILALHGMPGCGKTVIAMSVLRHNAEMVTGNFSGVVFWLNLSNCKTEDDIIAQQNKLYRKASTMYSTSNSYMNSSVSMSSIGSNADSLHSSDWTWQELKDKLKMVFEEPIRKEALLVLDEVNEKKCLEAFDIGCKILVTTRDTEVVANLQPQIVKIENEMTEEESLSLLAACVDMNVGDLPRQAKKLHDICKGDPFNMALIGAELAENKERLQHDSRHWNFYINKLEKRELFSIIRPHYNPMKPIEMCIGSLKTDTLALFKKLAVLPDNARVSTVVLSKLWNKDMNEVKGIMRQLRSKSLIIETYDHEQRNYIYEIHYRIMSYLRSSTSVDLRRLHADLLKSYNYMNADDVPVELQDDGYIAFYIGHHLLNTRNLNHAWRMFNKLFLDLKFIGNKVRLTGIADVKLDLQKYESYIASETLDLDLLYSIRAYLNRSGNDLHKFPGTDIIQSVLQNESQGILYGRAWEVARRACADNELYFEFLHEQDEKDMNQSVIDVKGTITAVAFLGDFVLVGTDNGFIKFFHIATNKLNKELATGNSRVEWIGACAVSPPLLACLCRDGIIRVWCVDDIELVGPEDAIEEESDESYNNNYPNNMTIQNKGGPFINCRWANHMVGLVAHTRSHIYVYGVDGTVVQSVDLYQDGEIACCVPCDDKRLVVALANRLEVYHLNTNVGQTFDENGSIMNILVVPGGNRILILKEKEVTEHVFPTSSRYERKEGSKCVVTSETVKAGARFLSMAVNKTGTVLYVSTDDGRVACVDLQTYSYMFDLQNKRGNVVTMATSEVSVWDDFEPGSDVLLTGTGTVENSAKVWYLDAPFIKQNTEKNGKVRLTTKFDVSFISVASPNTPVSTASGSQTTSNTPKRHQSFVNREQVKRQIRSTMSLDRHSLKPLNLKGICNGNADGVTHPLIAVVDERNNIQVMRGTKLLTQITHYDEKITTLKISPCNHYVIYGLKSGIVRKYTIRTKENVEIMDVCSPVEYLKYVNPNLLIVASKNRCLMAYRPDEHGDWKPNMLQQGTSHLGSQELLNGIQGIKKKSTHDTASIDSDTSIGYSRSPCRGSSLVNCYWVQEIGLVTIESNATVKLWDRELNMLSVLNGRQFDVYIHHCALQKNILVLCDDYSFMTFELQKRDRYVELKIIQEFKLNSRIASCALTEDGNVLALGLESGEVVIWNVPKKRQLCLLKHHKMRVSWCGWSPVPQRPPRASPASPLYAPAADEPPLVLVTMATELLWWNITYKIRQGPKGRNSRSGWNAVTPISSPIDARNDATTPTPDNSSNNFFFGAAVNPHHCWRLNWKNKTYKQGAKRKEILSCIKLSGMHARRVCHDDKFAWFVTVDNAGHVHAMNVMDAPP